MQKNIMQISTSLKNQHLLWRSGFGVSQSQQKFLTNTKTLDLLDTIFKNSSGAPSILDVTDSEINNIQKEIQNASAGDVTAAKTQALRKIFREKSTESIRLLNQEWVDIMVKSEAQLREKTALFWHGHFACRNLNIFYHQILLHEIRTNALGSFRTLLKSVSKTAAMILFLNNQQNKKGSPNENFAREVMELFTMGRGNYSEQDIKEAARAFTGWSAQINGDFLFKPLLHDDGQKTFLKRTGNFTGDDIIEILLDQQQTAMYICKKIYKFYVNEKMNEDHLKWLTKRFFESNYDITQLLKDIFYSDWFYDKQNIGSQIKSPIVLLCGMRRQLDMKFQKPISEKTIQQLLGQVLFFPPNVAGWPGDKNWIDSSSLMFRMQLPQLIIKNEAIELRSKQDDDIQMGMQENQMYGAGRKKLSLFSANINWEDFFKAIRTTTEKDWIENIADKLLLKELGDNKINVIRSVSNSKASDYQQQVTAAIMSTPEYQLC